MLRRWIWLVVRQAEERPGFVGDVLEVDQTARETDDVQQVAMLGRARVRLMCTST
jgi:hypothetical protein